MTCGVFIDFIFLQRSLHFEISLCEMCLTHSLHLSFLTMPFIFWTFSHLYKRPSLEICLIARTLPDFVVCNPHAILPFPFFAISLLFLTSSLCNSLSISFLPLLFPYHPPTVQLLLSSFRRSPVVLLSFPCYSSVVSFRFFCHFSAIPHVFPQ